jgi:hypothetical protein
VASILKRSLASLVQPDSARSHQALPARRRLGRLHRVAPRLCPSRNDDRHTSQPIGGGQARSAGCWQRNTGGEGFLRRPRSMAECVLREETGYQWIQGTRPQTLAFGLTDSPAGLATWIVEKFGLRRGCRELVYPRSASREHQLLLGSPVRSARRSGPITRACTGRGRFRQGGPSMFRRGTLSFRARSSARPGRRRHGPTATSGAGVSCRAAAISPRWSSQRRSPMR